MHDDNILVDWSFPLQNAIMQSVEKNYPNEVHRWPLLSHFTSRGYKWKNKIVIALYNQQLGIDTIGKVEDVDLSVSLDDPSKSNIGSWQEFLISNFSI